MNAKLTEFDIIQTYFTSEMTDNVEIGIGDDAAVLISDPQQHLVTCVDTLVENVHFLPKTKPEDIAYKSIAVNLSDMAAMAAQPLWFTLALTLPKVNPSWLQSFSLGLKAICKEFSIQLVGGDTTRGPLTISVQMLGQIPPKQALTRSGAKVDDLIVVSQPLGLAALALDFLQTNNQQNLQPALLEALHRPKARIKLGMQLRSLANACIDVSDGLLADLKHIMQASSVGAQLNLSQIPLANFQTLANPISISQALQAALTGGDDYALCFTISPENFSELQNKIGLAQKLFVIGTIIEEQKLILEKQTQYDLDVTQLGYIHF